MAQQNIPTQPSPKTTQYMNLLGVDYQSDSTEVSTLRSPDMVNMISDLGGIPVKRYGYRRFGNAYEGVATIGGQNWAVKKMPQGTTPETYKLYVCTIDVSGGRVAEGSLVELSPRTNTGEVKHVFGFQNSLFVLCEKEWIEKDVETGLTKYLGINEGNMYELTEESGNKYIDLKMPDSKYIPTVYTMYKPNGKELITLPQGTDLTGATEGVNLLTPFRRAEYCVQVDTANETTFVIPNLSKMAARYNANKQVPYKVEILNSGTYEWKTLTAGTDYSIGATALYQCQFPDVDGEAYAETTAGRIEFASAPYTVVAVSGVNYLRFKDDNTKDVPSGVPNVRITYAAFDDGGVEQLTRKQTMETNVEGTAELAVSSDYSTSGSNPFIITLNNTPQGAVVVQYFETATSRHETNTYLVEKTVGVGGYSFSDQIAIADGTAIRTIEYDGDRTIQIKYSNSATASGSVSRFGNARYLNDVPQQITLPSTIAMGTTIVIEGFEGNTKVDFRAYKGRKTVMPEGVVFYDGNRTVFVIAAFFQGAWHETRVTSFQFTVNDTVSPAYRKERRNDLYKSDAVTLFDARLFGGVGIHTYYSRASEPFKIDDNFYFDVDNDVLAYTRASRYLAVITEDIGRNTIFLASGEYDNDLAMMVYTVRASNAGVGAVTAHVSGTLNDEPLFLSRTGIYGISTNYLSEKYAISRSGKINKHLCREEHLETAVGIAHNNYFYIAINGKMYVLDGRHRDASRNGDNSYECYFFDNMPIITDMFVVDNRLLFSDGTYTYAWNDDLEEDYQYIDRAVWNDELQRWEGEPVACKWTSKLDGDGAPHYYKVLSKKGTMVTVAPPMQTGCQITIIKDAHDEYYIGRFNGSTFALSDSVMDAFTKKKIKKYKRLQFVIENKEAEPFGLISVVKTFTLGNYAKR